MFLGQRMSLPPKKQAPNSPNRLLGSAPAQRGQVGLAVCATTRPSAVALGMTLESLSRKSLGTDWCCVLRMKNRSRAGTIFLLTGPWHREPSSLTFLNTRDHREMTWTFSVRQQPNTHRLCSKPLDCSSSHPHNNPVREVLLLPPCYR